MRTQFLEVEEETLGRLDSKGVQQFQAFDIVSGRTLGNEEELCSTPRGLWGEEGCYLVDSTELTFSGDKCKRRREK